MIPCATANTGGGHHSKQRPPSPLLRDEEKRRTHDDKWKSDNIVSDRDKLIRDRAHNSDRRAPPYDEATVHDPLSNKHTLSSRLSKSSRAPSLEYVRRNPEPVLTLAAKKKPVLKPKDNKPVDKVGRHNS